MVPVTILQSYQQGITVWGEAGHGRPVGRRHQETHRRRDRLTPRLARDLATLIGQHDVPVRSASYGDGRASEQISLRRQDILQPADIRALPPGTALLLATGARPALIGLRPWYTGPGAARISAAIRPPRTPCGAGRSSPAPRRPQPESPAEASIDRVRRPFEQRHRHQRPASPATRVREP